MIVFAHKHGRLTSLPHFLNFCLFTTLHHKVDFLFHFPPLCIHNTLKAPEIKGYSRSFLENEPTATVFLKSSTRGNVWRIFPSKCTLCCFFLCWRTCQMMIQETDTTTRSAASAIDTGYPMTGSSSWSVRRDSIQNLPIPYPARYSKKTSHQTACVW